MIESFGNQLTEDLFADRNSKATRSFPSELKRVARRKLLYLHDAAELIDMRVPPGNRLEVLKGSLKGNHSIRINDQWRLVFRWENGSPNDVQIMDDHS
jgi:proteic killer suppression protein